MSNKITVSAMVNAEKSIVWDCYTNPKHIVHWNFADPSWHCPRAENDMTIGGKYVARMEARDGSFGFDFWGIYDEVIPHKKISYTMGDGRKAITDFEQQNEKIKIVFG